MRTSTVHDNNGLPEGTAAAVRIADVIVGERARKDYGDLASLIESIREHGVLQPIGVLAGNRLLFGGRRLEACRQLGWESIPYTRPRTRDDALALLTAERDENTCRKDMTPEEQVDLGLRIEEIEGPRAQERQAEGQRAGAAATNEMRWGVASGSAEPEATERFSGPSRTAQEVGAVTGHELRLGFDLTGCRVGVRPGPQ